MILESWGLTAMATDTCMFKNILGLTQLRLIDKAIVCTMLDKSAQHFTYIVPPGPHKCPVGKFIIIIIFLPCCL